MQFHFQNQQITLHGLRAGAIHLASKRQATKCCNSVKGACTLLMISGDAVEEHKDHDMPCDL